MHTFLCSHLLDPIKREIFKERGPFRVLSNFIYFFTFTDFVLLFGGEDEEIIIL